MEQLLTSLTKTSIKELERNNFRYPLVGVTDPTSDDDNASIIGDDARSTSASISSDDNEAALEEQLTRLGIKDNDGITYVGRSASIELLNTDLFRLRPYITWPGHDHIGLQLTSQGELMVVRKTRVDIGVSMRIDLDDESATAVKPTSLLPSTALDQLSQEQVDSLIATYFNHLHPSFPIINKNRFLETKQPPTLLVHAILALTLRFISQHFVRDNAELDQQYAAFYFAKVMKRLREASRSKMSLVQAAVLMTLYLDDDGDDDATQWFTLGTAIRMAQDLGLHRSCAHWKMLPPCEIETRHRVFYACYILDRWLSARGGRPLTILDRDFDTSLPSVYENDEPIYRGFVIMARLSEILGRLLKALYAPKAKHANNNASLDDPTLLEAFDRRLKACKMGIMEEDMPLAQKVYLEIYYNTVVLLLHRPFLNQNAMSHHACTAAASNIGNLVRQQLPHPQENDPSTCFSLTLPTCLIYSLYQCTLVHLANAVRDPNTTEALDRSMALVQQFQHMATARRAHDVLGMFRAIQLSLLAAMPPPSQTSATTLGHPFQQHHQQQQPVVYSNDLYAHTSTATPVQHPHIFDWPSAAAAAAAAVAGAPLMTSAQQQPPPGTTFFNPQQEFFNTITASPSSMHSSLASSNTPAPSATNSSTALSHQHANSLSSTSSSSSYVSTPHPNSILWTDWDVYATCHPSSSNNTASTPNAAPSTHHPHPHPHHPSPFDFHIPPSQ
ncbi:hypothetical protein K492DRAFT_177699 [Lichtheimia hyalospora FSU 10163]|nr:hypothetical protein K492DRAFT_177699 [Lichtheimia hyalospora FSU 10163]